VLNESAFPPQRVTVMGVLNLTPDSFSDGGRFVAPGDGPRIAAVVEAAAALVAAGAHLLDVGGESTRPGAVPVPLDEEIARTAPVVAALAAKLSVAISIDTRNASVARAAVTAGATLINDVTGLSHDPAVADVAAESGALLILGHIRGTPQSMQQEPHYADFLAEVAADLEVSVARARSAGVTRAQLVVDPGIGFGKRLDDNLQLLAHAGWLREQLGLPLLLGPSRKSFLGKITGDPVEEREVATYAACAIAAASGADGVRVHDAGGARRAVAIGRAVRDARRKELT
jgi:dihydropteroate synthase